MKKIKALIMLIALLATSSAMAGPEFRSAAYRASENDLASCIFGQITTSLILANAGKLTDKRKKISLAWVKIMTAAVNTKGPDSRQIYTSIFNSKKNQFIALKGQSRSQAKLALDNWKTCQKLTYLVRAYGK